MIILLTLLKCNRLQLDLQVMWMGLVVKLDLQIMRSNAFEYGLNNDKVESRVSCLMFKICLY